MGKHLSKKGLRKCYICKKTFPLNNKYFYKNKSKSTGYHFSCKKCHVIAQVKRKKRRISPKSVYIQRKSNVKCSRKHIVWELPFDDFMKLWQKPCYYCGSEIKTIGIDRVNSNLGYVKSNCVPCCIICNLMKRKLTIEEFINHCKKIINNHRISGLFV